MIEKIVTIGAYGYDADRFFAALQAAGVDTFCDVRRRRGVRGSEYAFANRARLEARLAELGIRYVHRLDLAPDNELRQAQYAVDAAAHVGKRARQVLSPAFAEGYRRAQLAAFDSRQLCRGVGAGCACRCPLLRGDRTGGLSSLARGGAARCRSGRAGRESAALKIKHFADVLSAEIVHHAGESQTLSFAPGENDESPDCCQNENGRRRLCRRDRAG